MIIYGAGLSGCLAGALFPEAQIFEASGEKDHWGKHKAVLRFREESIAHATGIPFKKVKVRKSIWYCNTEHAQVTPRLANMYSVKVSGKISERSIGNLDPVERFIGPPDLHERLGQRCKGRVRFNSPMGAGGPPEALRLQAGPCISTLPLPALLEILDLKVPGLEFKHAAVEVERWQVPDCDVHQTIYFPGNETPVYRATLTGADLIIESTRQLSNEHERNYIANAFFLQLAGAKFVSGSTQKYGKIVPLPDSVRKELLLKITMQYGIYALGRFACWRNILLDDVYHDMRKIEQMAKMNHYDLIRSVT